MIEYNFPRDTLTYEFLADVETPAGVRTGSSILRINYHCFLSVSGVENCMHYVEGEAVYVDLADGKNLFITLSTAASGRPSGWKGALAGAVGPIPLGLHAVGYWENLKSGPSRKSLRKLIVDFPDKGAFNVPPANLPTTVTFADLNNPKSLVVVDPQNLAQSLGEGYSIKAVRIIPSRGSPSEKIEAVLPWLKSMRAADKKNRGWNLKDSPMDQLTSYSFKASKGQQPNSMFQ